MLERRGVGVVGPFVQDIDRGDRIKKSAWRCASTGMWDISSTGRCLNGEDIVSMEG